MASKQQAAEESVINERTGFPIQLASGSEDREPLIDPRPRWLACQAARLRGVPNITVDRMAFGLDSMSEKFEIPVTSVRRNLFESSQTQSLPHVHYQRKNPLLDART